MWNALITIGGSSIIISILRTFKPYWLNLNIISISGITST